MKQLPESLRATAPEIEWRRIAGLRDILAHAYFGVDEAIVWNVVEEKIPELTRAVRRLRTAGSKA